MENKTTTEWTSSGYRVTAEVTPVGLIIMSCYSRALIAKKDVPPERMIWLMSQVAMPTGTALGPPIAPRHRRPPN